MGMDFSCELINPFIKDYLFLMSFALIEQKLENLCSSFKNGKTFQQHYAKTNLEYIKTDTHPSFEI